MENENKVEGEENVEETNPENATSEGAPVEEKPEGEGEAAAA